MSKVDEKAFEDAKQAFIEYRKVSDHPLYCLQAGIEAYLAAKVPEQPVECASFDDNALEAAHDVAARHGIKKFVAARIVEAYIDILPKREYSVEESELVQVGAEATKWWCSGEKKQVLMDVCRHLLDKYRITRKERNPKHGKSWEVWGHYKGVPRYGIPPKEMRIATFDTKAHAQEFVKMSAEEAYEMGITPCGIDIRQSNEIEGGS